MRKLFFYLIKPIFLIAKRLAVRHYNRMIAWAKTRKPGETCSQEIMFRSIKENWYGKDCTFCKLNRLSCFIRGQNILMNECSIFEFNCPLKILKGNACCNGLWASMVAANTWGDWIIKATNVRNFIKNRKIIYRED